MFCYNGHSEANSEPQLDSELNLEISNKKISIAHAIELLDI